MRERMRPPPKADSSPHPPALAQIIGKALGLHAAYVTLAPGFIRSYDLRTQLRRCRMKRSCLPLVFIVLISLPLHAQLDRLVIPAGTPEDQALQAISNEPDAQKKLAMYEDFLQKFASNPAAVAYGNFRNMSKAPGICKKHWTMATKRWPVLPGIWTSSCRRRISPN